MRRFLNSLQGRVFLLSVLATLLVILLSSWIFSVDRTRYTRKLQEDFLVDYAVMAVQDLEQQSSGSVQSGTLWRGDAQMTGEEFLTNPGAVDSTLPSGLLKGEQDNLFWDATAWLEPRYTLQHLPNASEQHALFVTLRRELSAEKVTQIFIKTPEMVLNDSAELFSAAEESAPLVSAESALILSLILKDGRALNVMPIFSAQEEAFWDRELLLLIGSLFACMVLINLLAAAWMTRPLAKLEKAAARFGRDLDAPPLAETGITEVAQAGKAFNRMQQQITSLIEGRTAMLAAISHDLKTPITRLRLRTEMLQDEKTKAAIDKDLHDITAMVDAALGFLRNDALVEAVEAANLMELVQDYCAERQSVGDAITVVGMDEDCSLALRPLAVKRAFGNLIDNGLHYGGEVMVSLQRHPDTILLRVCDNGPGVPEHLLAEVVKPFVRAEQSRNRDTGGTGLGLSIVTSVMQLHGGELRLENKADQFCAVMVFPLV